MSKTIPIFEKKPSSMKKMNFKYRDNNPNVGVPSILHVDFFAKKQLPWNFRKTRAPRTIPRGSKATADGAWLGWNIFEVGMDFSWFLRFWGDILLTSYKSTSPSVLKKYPAMTIDISSSTSRFGTNLGGFSWNSQGWQADPQPGPKRVGHFPGSWSSAPYFETFFLVQQIGDGKIPPLVGILIFGI